MFISSYWSRPLYHIDSNIDVKGIDGRGRSNVYKRQRYINEMLVGGGCAVSSPKMGTAPKKIGDGP